MNKPTKTYDLYEIVKVPFPFTDIHATKVRPALVLSSPKYFNARVGCSLLAMVTSLKPTRNLWPSDVEIVDFISAGLSVSSIVRWKIFTLDHRLILSRLGSLSEKDRARIQKKLKEILEL